MFGIVLGIFNYCLLQDVSTTVLVATVQESLSPILITNTPFATLINEITHLTGETRVFTQHFHFIPLQKRGISRAPVKAEQSRVHLGHSLDC